MKCKLAPRAWPTPKKIVPAWDTMHFYFVE